MGGERVSFCYVVAGASPVHPSDKESYQSEGVKMIEVADSGREFGISIS